MTDPNPHNPVHEKATIGGRPKLLRVNDLQQIFGDVHRTTIYKWVEDKVLPPPMRLGKAMCWHPDDIDAAMLKMRGISLTA